MNNNNNTHTYDQNNSLENVIKSNFFSILKQSSLNTYYGWKFSSQQVEMKERNKN